MDGKRLRPFAGRRQPVFGSEWRLGMRTITMRERTDSTNTVSRVSNHGDGPRLIREWCFGCADDADGADANSEGGIQRSRPAFQASRMAV